MRVIGQARGFLRCVKEFDGEEIRIGDGVYHPLVGMFEVVLLEKCRDGSYLVGVMLADKPDGCVGRSDAVELSEWPVLEDEQLRMV